MRILIVEDDEIILRTLEFKLKMEGFEVTAVINGKLALEMLQAREFDLVITDLMLPFVTGLEVLSYVKTHLPGLPVAVLSGADEEATVVEAFNIGADDFIPKPFSPKEVSLRVKRLLMKTPLNQNLVRT